MKMPNPHQVLILVAVLCGSISGIQDANAFQSVEPHPNVKKTATILKQAQFIAESQKVVVGQRLKELREEIQILETERNSILNNLNDKKISETSFVEVMKLLQTQRVQLAVDLAGLEARKTKLIDSAKDADNSDNSAVAIRLLEQYVSNQTRAANRIQAQVKNGVASSKQATEAHQLLIEAQLRLLEARQSTEKEPTSALVKELSRTELERVEKNARLAMVEKLLAQYVRARPDVDNFSRLDRTIESEMIKEYELKSEITEIQSNYNALLMQLMSQPNDDSEKDQ